MSWAGNPEKPVEVGPNGIRLTPRKSFEAWKQTVHGHCAPWAVGELQIAEALRVTLLEVVLRMSERARAERIRSHERQELLIAELNHRVRNILNLIRGLLSQSRSDSQSITEFTQTLSGRIQALANAHDQITAKSWEPVSLQDLITTELDAYLGKKADRVAVSGPDVMLYPETYTTMALVIHELVTNSAKYGALSDSSGKIAIKLEETPTQELSIAWRELGGPPVKAPLRRGFGSTVVERAIPFELGGTAQTRFELAGFEADFTIPASRISEFKTDALSDRTSAHKTSESESSDIPNQLALIVEDNMIIALDAEDHLRRLGVRDVQIASGVSDALQLLSHCKPDFAILDLNLGSETSAPVADRLQELEIPFLFATGYGETADLAEKYPSALIVSKPFNEDSLSSAIRTVTRRA